MDVIPLSALAGACEEQLALARAEWPEGVPVTDAAAARAVALGLDLDWAARKLLPEPARAEYQRVAAAACAEYQRVAEPARAEYQRVRAAALLRLLKEVER